MLTILIAGPYRSGTTMIPVLMERNLRILEEAALLYLGPVISPGNRGMVCIAIIKSGRLKISGDEIYEEILYPGRCNA